MMEAEVSSETLAVIYHIKRRLIPEDGIIHRQILPLHNIRGRAGPEISEHFTAMPVSGLRITE
jgi:hypothetical protein